MRNKNKSILISLAAILLSVSAQAGQVCAENGITTVVVEKNTKTRRYTLSVCESFLGSGKCQRLGKEGGYTIHEVAGAHAYFHAHTNTPFNFPAASRDQALNDAIIAGDDNSKPCSTFVSDARKYGELLIEAIEEGTAKMMSGPTIANDAAIKNVAAAAGGFAKSLGQTTAAK